MTSTADRAMRLGRLPHDPVRLAAAPSLMAHTFGVMAPEPRLDRSGVPFTPGLYDNDTLPDCTTVGLINAARAVSALAGYDLAIDPTTVPAFYADCIGQPGASLATLAATDGAQLLNVLVRQSSLGVNVGLQAPLVGLFGTTPIVSRAALANAMTHLGAGYWGVDLYEADMDLPPVWDGGAPAGNLVGGHCLIGWDYTGLSDSATVRLGTWGGWQKATWGWLRSRLREAHAIVWPQSQTTVVDRARLAADLATWSNTA